MEILEQYVNHLQQRLQIVHEQARDKLHLESDRMKTRYDIKENSTGFNPKDKVWLYNPRCAKGKSLKPQKDWDSPFHVIARINDMVYQMQQRLTTKMKIVLSGWRHIHDPGGTNYDPGSIFITALVIKEGKLDEAKTIIVSISVQPVLSLAYKYDLAPNDCAAKLATYLKMLGADMVVDMTIAEDFSLIEAHREFMRRYRSTEQDGAKNVLPLLASSCPGWVCYAEKTHGSYILPYISSTKSPQQIMGSLIKQWVGQNKSIYHVTVMPCYDKKLEAAREDFTDRNTKIRDVDCVITAIELEQMLHTSNISLDTLENSKFSRPWIHNDADPCLYSHIGSGSGGYSDYIFINSAKELFGITCDTLKYRPLRNPDFKEAILEKDGKVLLRFAIANGFRNIQNLVQKLKRGKSHYHYVEVMACPSGCLNGGAQVRPNEGVLQKEVVLELEKLYSSLPVTTPEENKLVRSLYDSWLGGQESDKSSAVLHTQYHAVEKSHTALNIKW